MYKPCIYAIHCVPSDRFYIGWTNNFTERMISHRVGLRHGKHPCKELQADWDRYSPNDFTYTILEEIESEYLLRLAESKWISDYQAERKQLYPTMIASDETYIYNKELGFMQVCPIHPKQ